MIEDLKLVGILDGTSLDVDEFPIKELMPDGFVSVMGSALSGNHEFAGILDVSLKLGRKSFSCAMTVCQAKDLVVVLQGAIKNAEEIASTHETASK